MSANPKVINPVFIPTGDGRQALVGGTLGDGTTTGAAIEAIFRHAFIKSRVADVDTTFSGEHWTLHGQAGVTHAEGGSNHDQNYWFQGNTRVTLDLGPQRSNVHYLDLNPTNGAALHFVPANERDWIRIMKEDETYGQADLTFDLNNGFFKSFKTGVKYRDDKVNNNRQIGSVSPDNPNYAALSAITLNEVSSGTSPPSALPWRQASVRPGSWALSSPISIRQKASGTSLCWPRT